MAGVVVEGTSRAREERPAGLSPQSRALTAAAGVASAVTGALLFFGYAWSAPRFTWKVTELMVMSIGAWFLGNAVWAARIVRTWRWARDGSSLVYLWSFGVLQAGVLLAYRDKVVTDTLVAGLYLLTIALLVLAAVVGVVDLVRHRPVLVEPGRPLPALIRGLIFAFVAFVSFLFAVALLRPSAAVGGGVFPEDMSPFTVRSFGVYFLALVLGVLVLARCRTVEPFLAHASGGLGITLAILVASLVHLDRFSLGERPGQWIYLGSYVVVLVLGTFLLVRESRRGPS